MMNTVTTDGDHTELNEGDYDLELRQEEEMLQEAEEEYQWLRDQKFFLGGSVPIEELMDEAPGGIYANTPWALWDGGHMGGPASWLHPIPSDTNFACKICSLPMCLLTQLYCPLDTESAFHRVIYVFCCKDPACFKSPHGPSISVFRCQLPRTNEYHPYYPTAPDINLTTPPTHCALCNKPVPSSKTSKSLCGGCNVTAYCCREHQVEHWKVGGHKRDCKKSLDAGHLVVSEENKWKLINSGTSTGMFREFDIAIHFQRPDKSVAVDESERRIMDDFLSKETDNNDDPENPFTNDSEIDLEQDELHDLLNGGDTSKKRAITDPVYVEFLSEIASDKDQVVRYARDEGDVPLWMHSVGKKEDNDTIPNCTKCSAPRKFEFQIMPQFLWYLNKGATNTSDDVIEFGTLVVYTCSESCEYNERETAGVEEYFYVQPPLAEEADDESV